MIPIVLTIDYCFARIRLEDSLVVTKFREKS